MRQPVSNNQPNDPFRTEGYAGALTYEWSDSDETLIDSLVPAGHPSTPGFTDPQYPLEGRRA